jgi:hypothetical protein
MEKNLSSSQHVVAGSPLEADIRGVNRLKERVISTFTFPVMFLGTVCYVLAMWILERTGEVAH